MVKAPSCGRIIAQVDYKILPPDAEKLGKSDPPPSAGADPQTAVKSTP
jgi:hypothetical protein